MLVEIPDPDVIMAIVVAFVVGIFSLFLYYKVKPYVNIKPKNPDPAQFERLEYYERQLIDMKIRLDALELEEHSQGPVETRSDTRVSVMQESQRPEKVTQKVEEKNEKPEKRVPNLGYNDLADHVLRLITEKPMTSRDIQITVGRSREHTSRLMKKLFVDGYVKRNTNTKPYTYSITDKGKDKLQLIKSAPTLA